MAGGDVVLRQKLPSLDVARSKMLKVYHRDLSERGSGKVAITKPSKMTTSHRIFVAFCLLTSVDRGERRMSFISRDTFIRLRSHSRRVFWLADT